MSGNSNDPVVKEKWMKGLLKGWRTRLPSALTTLIMDNKEMPRESIRDVLEEVVAACDAVEPLRRKLASAIALRNKKLEETDRLATSFEALVRATHGEDAEALAAYDLEPRKKHVATVNEKAIATVRRLAARAKNGTMGSRQRRRLAGPTMRVLDADGRDIVEMAQDARRDPIDGIVITEVPPAPPREPLQLSSGSDEPTKR